jgi:hypothetical protein
VLETAFLLSRLQELPGEPLRNRAIEELGTIYRILQQIRRLIGGEVRFVLQRAEHELHRAATRLETPLPIDWDF